MEKQEKAVQAVFAKRAQRDLNAPLDKADKDVVSFSSALDAVAAYFPSAREPRLE